MCRKLRFLFFLLIPRLFFLRLASLSIQNVCVRAFVCVYKRWNNALPHFYDYLKPLQSGRPLAASARACDGPRPRTMPQVLSKFNIRRADEALCQAPSLRQRRRDSEKGNRTCQKEADGGLARAGLKQFANDVVRCSLLEDVSKGGTAAPNPLQKPVKSQF